MNVKVSKSALLNTILIKIHRSNKKNTMPDMSHMYMYSKYARIHSTPADLLKLMTVTRLVCPNHKLPLSKHTEIDYT